MDPDFLSNLLKGQGGQNPLTALLPLFLGGNKSNLSSLLGSFGGAAQQEKGESFPPLFGAPSPSSPSSDTGIFNVLSQFFSSRSNIKTETKSPDPYPYELQYNRPDIHKLHKN